MESRRHGRLVFIGFTDGSLCSKAERLGLRVLYAPIGERTACLVREVDALRVCGGAAELGGRGNPAGGGGVGAAVGDTSPFSAQPAGYNHAAVVAVPAAAASTMESATATGGDDRALFERILEEVASARRGSRRAVPLSASMNRNLVVKLDELAEELGVNISRLVEALVRFALVKLGYLPPPE